jgi:hypothetical protein
MEDADEKKCEAYEAIEIMYARCSHTWDLSPRDIVNFSRMNRFINDFWVKLPERERYGLLCTAILREKGYEAIRTLLNSGSILMPLEVATPGHLSRIFGESFSQAREWQYVLNRYFGDTNWGPRQTFMAMIGLRPRLPPRKNAKNHWYDRL